MNDPTREQDDYVKVVKVKENKRNSIKNNSDQVKTKANSKSPLKRRSSQPLIVQSTGTNWKSTYKANGVFGQFEPLSKTETKLEEEYMKTKVVKRNSITSPIKIKPRINNDDKKIKLKYEDWNKIIEFKNKNENDKIIKINDQKENQKKKSEVRSKSSISIRVNKQSESVPDDSSDLDMNDLK